MRCAKDGQTKTEAPPATRPPMKHNLTINLLIPIPPARDFSHATSGAVATRETFLSREDFSLAFTHSQRIFPGGFKVVSPLIL